MALGRFISFEGVDGAGKSTQLAAVAATLQARGLDCVLTREPGGTPLGEALRTLALGQDMAPMTETLLMFAARNEHVQQCIGPALAAGRWVLCDRYTDASYAYQGAGRGVALARLDALSDWVQAGCRPDLTVLVDIDPAEAQRRRERARAADRFEQESAAFFERVRAGYRQRAAQDPQRFLLVDGANAADGVTASILLRLAPWLA
jgi:dTMP kinase